MKLQAKAKPVKIRITSGGEEHSSLESLRNNFVWKDISQLFDGRLVKWLRRIDEPEKAQQIEEIKDYDKQILEVYSILFPSVKKFQSVEDLLLEFQKDGTLFPLVLPTLKNCNGLELANYYLDSRFSQSHHIIKSLIEILPIENTKAEDLFKIGEILSTDSTTIDISKRLLTKAEIKGSIKAKEFLNKHFEGDVNSTLNTIYEDENFKQILKQSWDDLEEIPLVTYKGKKKELLEFSNNCIKLVRLASKKKAKEWEVSGVAYNYFYNESSSFLNNDFLGTEKFFVIALFENDESKQKNLLKKIKDYPPAKELLNKPYFTIENHTFYRSPSNTLNINEIRFFVNNLPLFRNPNGINETNITNFDSIREIYKSKRIQNKLRESWRTLSVIDNEKCSSPEKEIFEFSNHCIELVKPDKYGKKDVCRLARNFFSNLPNNAILYEEQTFLRALFETNSKLQKELLTKINYYPPAKYLLSHKSLTINDITFYKDAVYSNISSLRFFVLNLDIFWEWQEK